jgi:hypothetical protein
MPSARWADLQVIRRKNINIRLAMKRKNHPFFYFFLFIFFKTKDHL